MPSNVLGSILRFLDLHERFRVKSVCRSWSHELGPCGALDIVDAGRYFSGFTSEWLPWSC